MSVIVSFPMFITVRVCAVDYGKNRTYIYIYICIYTAKENVLEAGIAALLYSALLFWEQLH